MTEPNEFFIVYESWQIDSARAHAVRGVTVVCLDFLVERELRKIGVPCVSLRDIIDSDTGEEEWWLLAQEVAREWYRLPAMKFFQHNDIAIGEVVEPIVVEAYLTRLFYFARVYMALKKEYPNARLSIPFPSVVDPLDADCLVSFERRAVVDAARVVGLESTVIDTRSVSRKLSFPKIAWKPLFIRAYNLLMGLTPRRGLKIYASEYWSHIGPIMERMEDTELTLLDDGGELVYIPWRQLLKHRVRTRHPNDVIRNDVGINEATEASKGFRKQWEAAKEEVAAYLADVRVGLNWNPVLEAFEYLINYAPRVVADIEAMRRIMREEKPNVVLQLASIGGRHHYFLILARVAAKLDIPSIELQHASAYTDPRVVYSRIETTYLATYGAAPNSWYERISNTRGRLTAVGSARFDQYLEDRAGARKRGKSLLRQLGLDISRPVLFAAVPYLSANFYHFDSYQTADFFRTFRDVQSVLPGLQVLFKCRNNRLVGPARAYMRELDFTDCAATAEEDIFALLSASDAATCGRSTIIYQAMLAQIPLVLYPWKAYDTHNARAYAPAAPLVRSREEATRVLTRVFSDAAYVRELLTQQGHFLKGYSFDGGASERIVRLVEQLARKNHEPTSD